MGCFSYNCKECGKGIQSTSFDGEECHLFLLDGGKVVDQMTGKYDSYGRVFIPNSQVATVSHDLMESQSWTYKEWGDLVSMHFGPDESTGFAAVHVACFSGMPQTRSEDDPNQGWGEECELMGEIGDMPNAS